MNMMNPKRPRVEDSAYLKHLRNQPCIVSGFEYSEMGSMGVDPSHITFGRYGRGMKPDDWHCLPLRHDLHLKCDAGNQAHFWQAAFAEDPHLMMDAVKALAKWRYLRWVHDTGRDVAEAMKEMSHE